MNILLINHYAGAPQYGMEYRPFYMAREWVRMGHNVTIIGANFSHLRNQNPNKGKECIEGINYIWMNTPKYDGNGIGRVLNMVSFILLLFKNHKKIIDIAIPDLVIASSTYPLDIYPAKYIAAKSNAKLIYEVHDLWPLSPMELAGMSKYHPFIMVMQLAENYAYKVADKIISMLPKGEQHMLDHGLAHGKFQYIPNGIDSFEWFNESEKIPKKHEEVFEQLQKDNKFIIGYAGGHAISNALIFLIKAAEKILDPDVCFVLVGKGIEKDNLEMLVKAKKLNNVVFLPAVNKQSIPNLLEKCDALYIGWNNISLYRFGVCPNKLFDYMMSGKPIIHSINAGNDIVAEAKCGLSVPAEDVNAIVKAVIEMKCLSDQERQEMGKRGKVFVRENHDYKILARKFIDFVFGE